MTTTIYAEIGMLSARQLRRLSVIRVDSEAQTLRLSIHCYDKMRLDIGEDSTDNTTRKPGRPRLHIGGGVQERLYLPLDVHEWLKREAERLNIPKSQIVTEMVRQKILKD